MDDTRRPVATPARCAGCDAYVQYRESDVAGRVVLDAYPHAAGGWVIRADLTATYAGAPVAGGYRIHRCEALSGAESDETA